MKVSLKAARVNAGLRQTDVAEKLKINVATVGNWETGRTFPNAYHLHQLSELYGVNIDDFSLAKMFN